MSSAAGSERVCRQNVDNMSTCCRQDRGEPCSSPGVTSGARGAASCSSAWSWASSPCCPPSFRRPRRRARATARRAALAAARPPRLAPNSQSVFSRSVLDQAALDEWRQVDGVEVSPVGVSFVNAAPVEAGPSLDLALFGVPADSFLVERPRRGRRSPVHPASCSPPSSRTRACRSATSTAWRATTSRCPCWASPSPARTARPGLHVARHLAGHQLRRRPLRAGSRPSPRRALGHRPHRGGRRRRLRDRDQDRRPTTARRGLGRPTMTLIARSSS